MITRFSSLLAWRVDHAGPVGYEWTPHQLENAMTVEGLPYEQIPDRLRDEVTAFRHLRRIDRLAHCVRFLDHEGS